MREVIHWPAAKAAPGNRSIGKGAILEVSVIAADLAIEAAEDSAIEPAAVAAPQQAGVTAAVTASATAA